MEYVAQLPKTRKMVAPLVALVIGAGGAVGAYALIDDTNAGETKRVVRSQSPAPPRAIRVLRWWGGFFFVMYSFSMC